MHKMLALLCLTGVSALPATAGAQTTRPPAKMSIQGFGGFTFGNSSFVGGTSFGSTFGGTLAADLTPNTQAIGEFGRMSDIKPPLFNLLEFTPADLRTRPGMAKEECDSSRHRIQSCVRTAKRRSDSRG
jgi:hypothetical protein